MVNFKEFWLTWLVAFAPIVTICLVIFIFFIYPDQKFSLYDTPTTQAAYEFNSINADKNASQFSFGCVMSVILSMIMAIGCTALYNIYKINTLDTIIVEARLVSKDIRSQSFNSWSGLTQMATYFVVDFELEDKTIKQFMVNAKQFSFMFEENKGRLIYKEYVKRIFIDFIVDN